MCSDTLLLALGSLEIIYLALCGNECKSIRVNILAFTLWSNTTLISLLIIVTQVYNYILG